MKTYELTYIISPQMTSQEAEGKAKEIESAVQSRDGVIIKQTTPVARTLSYPINKSGSGFLTVLEFQLEPEKLVEIKEVLKKDGKVLRDMVIIKEPLKYKKPRRTRKKDLDSFSIEKKEPEMKIEKKSVPAFADEAEDKKIELKPKVELKDIEKELGEILGE